MHKSSKPEPHIVNSIKALVDGIAEPHQQKAAMDWIIVNISRTYEPSYAKGDPEQTAYNEGSRSVGLEIIGILQLNASKLVGGKS